MLEPAVRPGNLPAPGVRGPAPIEQQSFEELLHQAQQTEGGTAGADRTPAPAAAVTHPPGLGGLSGVDHIENPFLRTIVGGGAGPTRTDGNL